MGRERLRIGLRVTTPGALVIASIAQSREEYFP